MAFAKKIIEIEKVVIKFAGDSGDGMQLTGSQFSDESAWLGNDIATFPDYPSEIRAPAGTVAGVSGFQLHFGKKGIHSPGDIADVLVAMNPAALKTNIKNIRYQASIIIDVDSFDKKSFEKAEFNSNPLEDGSLDEFELIKVPITSLTKKCILALDLGIDNKSIMRCKNFFALGFINCMFNRSNTQSENFINEKFKKNSLLVKANVAALRTGYNFADTIEAVSFAYTILPSSNKPGKYRNITGNKAVAWGLMAASEKTNLPLFLGSYPITPATDIMQELVKHKWIGAKVFQAEDEIAGICSSIGASFAGNLAVTTTSGPGLALKGEAIGLAVMTELPLVIVNVQRGGPSTGLPTKTEQSDLLQALYGRNGESPLVVIAASSPSDCFDYAYNACKIAIEHMTPVILLTDGYLGNGSEAWRIKSVKELSEIQVGHVDHEVKDWKPYERNPESLARKWVIPGMKGFEHRIGGLEKQDISGNVSHDPVNHEKMVKQRAAKVKRVENFIPLQKVKGKENDGLLVVGWGGTYGTLYGAVSELQNEGLNISFSHFNYINPLPKNTFEIFNRYKKIVICELNTGQFASHLRNLFPQFDYLQINKIQGQPFTIKELKEKISGIKI
ncbi:MAG: 2-oxoacid:acceptor oxidoreductase subunit alpha [Sphingobacteriaceae bacterium]|nr:2-oxoacid:acceptor oxidoreductase subunit alpha [Sphingobacteriaceae bacterium]